MAKEYGATTVLDAAQAAGLIDLDMPNLNADILCFAGHKTLMGPFGIGGFLIKRGITLKKVFTGGTGSASLILDMPEETPGRYEASSANVVAIAGLNASLRSLNIDEHKEIVRELTEYLLEALENLIAKKLPEFAEQVIIFMLDKDWASSGLDEFVLPEYCYRVNKEEKSNSSTIERGGFE